MHGVIHLVVVCGQNIQKAMPSFRTGHSRSQQLPIEIPTLACHPANVHQDFKSLIGFREFSEHMQVVCELHCAPEQR